MFSPLTREDLVTWKVALEMKPDFTSDAACQADKKVYDHDTSVDRDYWALVDIDASFFHSTC